MMALQEIMIWIVQAVLFGIGIGIALLTAHLACRWPQPSRSTN
jgi:hypothetical protein